MKVLRVLVLVHTHLVPPENASASEAEHAEWKTEYDVVTALQKLGHEVKPLGLQDDLSVAVYADEGVRHKIIGVTRFGFAVCEWQI